MRHRLDRLVCQVLAHPARRACVDGTAVRKANERGQREETRQGARTDRHVRTPPHAQQRVALPMRAVLTVVRVVGLRRGRCGRGGQRTRATLRRAPSATALAHRTHTYNSPAIRPTRHHTYVPHPRTRTHTHTTTTTTYETFSDVMLGQPCATDSIDLSVNFPQRLRVVRAWMGRRSERRTSEGRGSRHVRGLALIHSRERRPTLSSGWRCRCGRCGWSCG